MADTRPGPDELRVREILRTRGVGPDTDEPDHLPEEIESRPRDWLDDILEASDEPAAPDPDPGPVDPKPHPAPRKRVRLGKARPTKQAHRAKADRHPATADPRRSLIEAWDAVPYRVRRLIANLAAAGLGWTLNLVAFTEDICDWVHDHGPGDSQSIFWFVVGVGCLALARRFRGRWWPVAWLATVPAASAIAGVLLYAPTA